MPHPRQLKPSVSLVHATFGDLVQVQGLEHSTVSGDAPPLGLRAGEVVQCLRNDEDGVLVARGDGSRILVPLWTARKIRIIWFPESLDAGELPAGPSTGDRTARNPSSAIGRSGGGGLEPDPLRAAPGEFRRWRRPGLGDA